MCLFVLLNVYFITTKMFYICRIGISTFTPIKSLTIIMLAPALSPVFITNIFYSIFQSIYILTKESKNTFIFHFWLTYKDAFA